MHCHLITLYQNYTQSAKASKILQHLQFSYHELAGDWLMLNPYEQCSENVSTSAHPRPVALLHMLQLNKPIRTYNWFILSFPKSHPSLGSIIVSNGFLNHILFTVKKNNTQMGINNGKIFWTFYRNFYRNMSQSIWS